MLKIFGIIIAIVVLFVIICSKINSEQNEIKSWAIEKGMEVKNIDLHHTIIGTPFYYLNHGSYIYEVDMTNGEKWWVRTSIFGNDYEKGK